MYGVSTKKLQNETCCQKIQGQVSNAFSTEQNGASFERAGGSAPKPGNKNIAEAKPNPSVALSDAKLKGSREKPSCSFDPPIELTRFTFKIKINSL